MAVAAATVRFCLTAVATSTAATSPTSATTTCRAPRSASAIASARPMPLAPPVTTAIASEIFIGLPRLYFLALEGLDHEGIRDFPVERIGGNDRIEVLPHMTDPTIADRKPEHIFVAIGAPVGEDHIASLLYEYAAPVPRDR